MRLLLALSCMVLVVLVHQAPVTAAPQWYSSASLGNSWNNFKNRARQTVDFTKGVGRGSSDMYRAYRDMRKANWVNSDRYFHARGNRDAAKHGAGGRFAAKTISDLREWSDQVFKGDSKASSARDQAANLHGRNGGHLGKYRPPNLPHQY